jgi:hypothetical protein
MNKAPRNSLTVLRKNYKLLVLLLSLFILGLASKKPGYDGEGIATITPPETVLTPKGEYRIKFIVGEHGIRVGGAIKARFPKRWQVQIKDRTKDNYLDIKLSRQSSNYTISLKKKDPSLDGKPSRNIIVITLKITENPLIRDDTITLTLSKRGIKSFPKFIHPVFRKYRPAFTEILPVSSDIDGDGNFAFIEDFPRFRVNPGPSEKIYVVAPTIHRVEESFDLKVVVLDKFNNKALGYTGKLEFTSSDKQAELPVPYTFSKDDSGTKRFSVTLNSSGYHTITVSDKSNNWKAVSNPIDCQESAPEEKIWWGDIHSHSEISPDGIGNGSFEYAKDVAGLDFYSLTDHSTGIAGDKWEFNKLKTIEFYNPGNFVTILGYECSMFSPSGHHNVFFNCSNDIIPQIPLIDRAEVKESILTLWQYLRKRLPKSVDVITIPHHTGQKFREKGKGTQVNFDGPYRNRRMRVALEIFSQHGTSEKYDPSNPFSYDTAWWPNDKSRRVHFPVNGPHYAQDAWAKKLYLGVIASSDDHQAHPGMPFPASNNSFQFNPLAAVYAKELTRDSIFNAIKARRTYATTGERIILNFSLEGYPMGDRAELEKGRSPKISVSARGTDLIDFVEILKWDFKQGKFDKDGHPIYEAVLHKKTNSMDVNLEFVDDNLKNDCLYYLRLKQLKTITDNEAWAWSSPIWVKVRKK